MRSSAHAIRTMASAVKPNVISIVGTTGVGKSQVSKIYEYTVKWEYRLTPSF